MIEENIKHTNIFIDTADMSEKIVNVKLLTFSLCGSRRLEELLSLFFLYKDFTRLNLSIT